MNVGPIWRYVGEGSPGDRLAQSWVDGFDGRSVSSDIDGLIRRAHLHLKSMRSASLIKRFLLCGAPAFYFTLPDKYISATRSAKTSGLASSRLVRTTTVSLSSTKREICVSKPCRDPSCSTTQ